MTMASYCHFKQTTFLIVGYAAIILLLQCVSMELEILGRHQHPDLTIPFLKVCCKLQPLKLCFHYLVEWILITLFPPSFYIHLHLVVINPNSIIESRFGTVFQNIYMRYLPLFYLTIDMIALVSTTIPKDFMHFLYLYIPTYLGAF